MVRQMSVAERLLPTTGKARPMAVNMSGEYVLPADRAMVWAKLNDPQILKVCIPGCESFEVDADGAYHVAAKVKIGPVSTRFKGTVTLSELDPPNSYKISGQGDGGISGFAKGGARVRLEDAEGGTKLIYDVEAEIGGKIAQLGSRLVASVAKKNADEFFANFAGVFA
jgi:uncharacterized protein